MSLIEVTREGAVGTIAVVNGRKRNVLSHDLVANLIDALTEFRDAQLGAVLVRSRHGEKVWSAGRNVSELPEDGRDPLGWDAPLRNRVRTLAAHPAPAIAMIESKFALIKERLRVLAGTKPLSPRGF